MNIYTDHGGVISISDMCLTSHPCQHRVIYNGDNRLFSAVKIYDILIENNIEIPEHFEYVKKIIERRQFIEDIKTLKLNSLKKLLESEDGIQLLEKYKNSAFNTAINRQDIDIVKYVVKDGSKLNESNFVCSISNLPILKYLVGLLDDYSILEKSSNELIKKCDSLIVLKYLLNDLELPLSEDSVMNIIEKVSLREYLIDKCVQRKVKIIYGLYVLRLKNLKLYDRFVELKITDKLDYTLIHNITYKGREIKKIDMKDIDLDDIENEEDKKITLELAMDVHTFNSTLDRLCNGTIPNIDFDLDVLRFNYSIKSWSFTVTFDRLCPIKSCVLVCNQSNIIDFDVENSKLVNIDEEERDKATTIIHNLGLHKDIISEVGRYLNKYVTKSTVSIDFLEPILFKYSVYSYTMLRFAFSNIAHNTHIKNLDYSIDFSDTFPYDYNGGRDVKLSETVTIREMCGMIAKLN